MNRKSRITCETNLLNLHSAASRSTWFAPVLTTSFVGTGAAFFGRFAGRLINPLQPTPKARCAPGNGAEPSIELKLNQPMFAEQRKQTLTI